MTEHLKPCPFCGGTATLEDDRLSWVVRCSGCGICVIGNRAPEPEGELPDSYWEPFRRSAIDRWNRRTAPAQPEAEGLSVNLRIDASPECLKRLCDGLAAAVKPDGGYRASTLDDPTPGTHGDQMVQVEWWIPQHGCDSLENTLDSIRYRIIGAVRDWWATALVPLPLAQPEADWPSDEELLGLDELRDAWNSQADAVNTWDELGIDEIIWFAQRQALARWGHPTPEPVPVSERPWEREGWCDERGMLWAWNSEVMWWDWLAFKFVALNTDDPYTHCLPYWALPVPATTEAD